jgi:cell division protein FtsW
MANQKPDYVLVIIPSVLLVLGIVILTGITAPLSLEKAGNPYWFLNHQIIFGIIPGIILFLLTFKIKLELIRKWAPIILLINLILVVMVFLPFIGIKSGGSSRWLTFGNGFAFQPSEFLKLTFILYGSSLLAARLQDRQKINFSQSFTAFFATIGIISLLLILQPDISTLGIIVLCGLIIYFGAGTPFWHTLSVVIFGILSLLYLIKSAPYRAQRWFVFLNPKEADPLGSGYQLNQALITVGSGGISGLGLGMSLQKFGFLPQSMTDSIFAIWAEETGFIGALILILLFLTLVIRGFKISKKSEDKFIKLTALGISSWFCWQALLNIGAMTGIIPITGIPLPFISYGGSHLVAEMAGLGILLNISKNS